MEDALELEKEFFEEEVRSAINGLEKDKAPGPDGFNIAFFQSCWKVVKGDIMGLFFDFHAKDMFQKSLNVTFLCLLPKMAGADDIKNLRPISLVGSVYKILAKVLASRLRKVVGKNVSPNQHAFIYGRQILDASLIANECIDFYLKSNQSGILCKLDIEKAYDHVSWSFLKVTLKKMGFSCKWRS